MSKSKDEWPIIYGDCQNSPVMQSLAGIVKQGSDAIAKRHRDAWLWSQREKSVAEMVRLGLHHDLLADAHTMLELLQDEYDAEFGPRINLVGGSRVAMNKGHLLTFDFSSVAPCSRGNVLRIPDEADVGEWWQRGLRRAGLMYRRECHWDFAPDCHGTWLVYVLLQGGCGGERRFQYSANVVGFAILNDRDDDGVCESLSHMWTARIARGKGVAKKLLTAARERFPLKSVEGPVTDLGNALLRAAWPEKATDALSAMG